MSRRHAALTVLLVVGVVLAVGPSGLWATSAVPEPGAIGIPIDPNASGTKLSGPLSIFYDLKENAADCAAIEIQNMFVVLTLQKGNTAKPFNIDLSGTANVPSPQAPVCFEETNKQVGLVFGLISSEAMPFFFGSSIQPCVDTGGIRPCWAVKSVTNILSSGTGAVSMTIELAEK